jgi:hypothetical protein
VYPFVPRPEEPAVLNPALAELVELARRQPVPRVGVTLEQVQVEHEGNKRRHRWMMGSMGAAAAALVVAFIGLSSKTASRESDSTAAQTQVASLERSATPQSSLRGAVPGASPVEVERAPIAVEEQPAAVAPESVEEVVAPQDVAEAPPAPMAVEQSTWNVRVGSTADTRRPDVRTTKTTSKRGASAAELARKADEAMAAGHRGEAIATLQTLARRYPRTAATKAGLLDLARLHGAAGNREQARCAYQTYLERWPTSRLRRDVERALDKLGGERTCRGLKPR